jgi:hypothetical protein
MAHILFQCKVFAFYLLHGIQITELPTNIADQALSVEEGLNKAVILNLIN